MQILITGGSGHLGRHLLESPEAREHAVRVLSRRAHPASADGAHWVEGDLITGEGLVEAVRGVDAIIHAASDSSAPEDTDVGGTRRLLQAARDAGVAHLVYVSIVGIDRIPLPYYARKLDAERLVRESGVPFSILRATQFHAFIETLLATSARLPLVMALPAGLRVQPVATEEVAARLWRAVRDGPRGMLPDFGGPEAIAIADAARLWLAARGKRRLVVPLPFPGGVVRALRAGHATVPDGEHGTVGWAEWLARGAPPRRSD